MMSNSLMIDNWTLQDVEDLISDGIQAGDSAEIVIARDRKSHTLEPLPHAAIQIDALLTLLSNIVCCEHLLVDTKWTHTWKRDGAMLSPLAELDIVQPTDYSDLNEQLNETQRILRDELCVVPTLMSQVGRLQMEWERFRRSSDPYLSAVVAGGAGMLARSQLTGSPYYGHPFRRKLLRETRMFVPQQLAVERLNSFLDTGRSRMFRYRDKQLSGTMGQLVLPPIPVQIIEEASSLEQLITIAVQLRDQNTKLRNWLGEYQTALDQEDEKKQIKFEKKLAAIAQSLENAYGANKAGSTGLSVSAAWFTFEIPRTLVDRIVNHFGIRATLSNLVLSSRGQKALTKLLRMLGEGQTTLGREIDTICRARYSQSSE